MPRRLSQEKQREVERRVEAQRIAYGRGREFKEAHQYEALVVEPTIELSPGDDTPMVQVWFFAVLKDPEKVDGYLRQIDQVIRQSGRDEEGRPDATR